MKWMCIKLMVAEISMKEFLGRVWYLSEELIALVFFDDGTSEDQRILWLVTYNGKELTNTSCFQETGLLCNGEHLQILQHYRTAIRFP